MVVPTENREFFVKMNSFADFLQKTPEFSKPPLTFSFSELLDSQGPLVFDMCVYLDHYRYAKIDSRFVEIYPEFIPVIRYICNLKIREYDKLKEDRNLDNDLKRNTLKNAKEARSLSIWAIAVASVAAVGSIAQALFLFLQP